MSCFIPYLIKINVFMYFVVLILKIPLMAIDGHIAQANQIHIWYETFGQKKDPAFLLIMGAGGQGLIWPTEFCERLAKQGFYVIRYDQRDAGLSTCIDFTRNPYTLFDMALDAISLLDALEINKAHVFGLSMGGAIAELMAGHFPERVATIALMGCHFDYRPYDLAMAGLPLEPGLLSSPKEQYLRAMEAIVKVSASTEDEKIEQRLKAWNLLNGAVFPLDEHATRQLQREYLAHCLHPENVKNYRQVIHRSIEMISDVHSKIHVPTVIFQGSEDPILGPDHAKGLKQAIPGSKYYYVEGMGHLPNSHFYDFLIAKLKHNIISAQNFQKFAAVKSLNLPIGQYAITGSGALGIRNLREIGDIDIIVTSELWDRLATTYEVIDVNGIIKIAFPDGIVEALREGSFYLEQSDPQAPTIAERIEQAEIIDGLPFELLEHVKYYKHKMGREKDWNDIVLIESWQKTQGKNMNILKEGQCQSSDWPAQLE